ncbi:MAG: alkaline phosphatase, partial [Thermoleophilaceae bacterium]|nr:alkaline phosphatase [Thermoleophilaceae bacterium]
PVGRTRTLVPATSTRPQRRGVSSCQNYPAGWFRAHAHAATQDLDLCVFLGDYIYEVKRAPSPNMPRVDPIEATDLRSYREKYRLYRTDEALRELHRIHPAVHIWDDHEVANNYTDNRPAPSPLQRAAGYRVAFEWLPRIVFPSERYRIFKRISLGATADLFLLDERQYRSVNADGKPVLILGERQMQWLIAGLKASRAQWKIIANQVVIAPMDFGSGESEDSWGGYDNSRTRLLGEIESAGISNVVFYTGDAHVFMMNVLASDPEVFRSDPSHRPTAVEYVGGSVTTPASDRAEPEVQARNPWIRTFNGTNHGYALVSADPFNLVTEFRRSEVASAFGGTTTFERFVQTAGSNAPARESPPART